MAELENNRLVRVFSELRADNKKTLLPFITAGYPDLETTGALLADFEARGVKVCELGIPFSDPIADGPVIQASYTEALAGGVTSDGIFDMVRRYRDNGGQLVLVAMVSYSIVFRHCPKEYLSAAAEVGFDGLIVPDLSLEEAEEFENLATSHSLANIMLIAPTTSQERRGKIARHSRGFIYYISVAGITGERDKLPDKTIQAVAELCKQTNMPICIGFGVSNANTVRTVCQVADGAIVGSAIVHRIEDAVAAGTPRDKLVSQIGNFVGELLEPITPP